MSLLEINGRVVDTATGQPAAMAAPAKRGGRQSRSSIDGVIRHKHMPKITQPDLAPKLAAKPAAHPVARHAHKHPPQKARTLTRQGLKAPRLSQPQKHHITDEAADLKTPLIAKADPARAVRAKTTHRHKLISRFGANSSSPIIKKTDHLPVARPKPFNPLPRAVSVPLPVDASGPTPGRFGAAIDSATSHQAHRVALPKSRARLAKKLGLSSRALGLVSATLATMAIVGFFAYQNIPNIKLRVAASRANVAGNLPAYKPSGFSIGQVESSPGQIVINFRSNTSDNRNFQITQRNSTWNSEALLANYVMANRYSYQIRQEQGKTIYIYQVNDNSNATWVDGGVWYNIESRASLNQDQLNQMALSL